MAEVPEYADIQVTYNVGGKMLTRRMRGLITEVVTDSNIWTVTSFTIEVRGLRYFDDVRTWMMAYDHDVMSEEELRNYKLPENWV